MFEFPADDPKLKKLFNVHIPNRPALWAVLKGNYQGTALVDDVQNPSQCVLRTDAALTYFNPQTRQGFLAEAATTLRGVGQVWLVWPLQTVLSPPHIEEAVIVQRVEFTDCNPASENLNHLLRQLPGDCEIHTIDSALFKRCEWRDEMEFYGGGFEDFLAHGIGICLMRNDEIIAEAYASALGKTRAEIGAITREPHRGRGYAPIACAKLIEICAERGYQAYWSCDRDHAASIRVAQKLGFRWEREYEIYAYEPL